VLDLNLVQGGVATRAEMRMALGFYARLVLKFQEGIGGLRARALHDGFQLARVEPETVALMTEINVEVPEVQDEQRDITLWANAFHASPRAYDGACGSDASSTSRIGDGIAGLLFIAGNRPEEYR
jgi:hypothetical protein